MTQIFETKNVKGGSRTKGDCFDILPEWPAEAYDMILTDPPYAMPATYYPTQLARTRRRWSDTLIMQQWFRGFVSMVRRNLKPDGTMGVFCDVVSSAVFCPAMYDTFPQVKHFVWDKLHAATGFPIRMQHELVLIGTTFEAWRRDGNVVTVIGSKRVPSQKRRHPAEKPVSVLAEIIEQLCPPGGHILDPFAGSGSTLDAALSVGRTCDLIEYDEYDFKHETGGQLLMSLPTEKGDADHDGETRHA